MFFVKMQNNTEENYYFFPLHQTHNYTYILWAYDKQCFYRIVNEILLFCFLHKACIYYIKKVIYFIEIVYTNTEVESYIGSIDFISLQKSF